MPRIYTEFRIAHKSIEEKNDYERKLDEALELSEYKTRNEFIQEKIRELMKNKK